MSPATLRDHMLLFLICDERTHLRQRGGLHWTLLDNTGLQVVSPFSPVALSITLTRWTSDLAVPLAELTLRYECI